MQDGKMLIAELQIVAWGFLLPLSTCLDVCRSKIIRVCRSLPTFIIKGKTAHHLIHLMLTFTHLVYLFLFLLMSFQTHCYPILLFLFLLSCHFRHTAIPFFCSCSFSHVISDTLLSHSHSIPAFD
uniref:Uncharacterized protein n=1 Tax=Anguilla anguilla TaxID=7936 RepID=A0A0E9WMY7_ANGAN